MKRSFSVAVEVLDGGMGHLLRRKGVEITGPIGSQRRFLGICLANIEQPDLVREAHMDYINAGATIITTNNYAVVPACLALGGEQYDLEHITYESCIQAKKAISSQHRKIKLAGSIPPLKESYRPDRVMEFYDMLESYTRIAVTLEPHVDFFLCETMSTISEAIAAASACDIMSEKEVHVAFTLSEDANGTLRSGERIEDAVQEMRKYSNVTAILLNCSSIQSIDAALPKLRQKCDGLRYGAYANAFRTVHSDGKCSDYDDLVTPEYYAQAVENWITEHGVHFVGGCCGIFPEHISLIRQRVDHMKDRVD